MLRLSQVFLDPLSSPIIFNVFLDIFFSIFLSKFGTVTECILVSPVIIMRTAAGAGRLGAFRTG